MKSAWLDNPRHEKDDDDRDAQDRRKGVVAHETGLDLPQSLAASTHTHRESRHGAVDDLGLDDVVTELRRFGERTSDRRVIEVIPMPDVLEEGRFEALGLDDVAPD